MANEKWTVKTAEAEEAKSSQEQEAAVLEKAVESGDVAPEYAPPKNEDGVIKINLDKPPTDEKADTDKGGVEPVAENADATPKQEEVPAQAEAQDEGGLELIEENEDTPGVEAAKAHPVAEQAPNQRQIPEEAEKLFSFMEETGGSIEEYAALNRNYDDFNDDDLVREFYKQKYPQYNESRLERKIKKDFGYDEDLDSEDDIQDKKDAFEDATYEAKEYLKGRKEKYYSDLKLRKQEELDPQTREAVDYYQQQRALAEANQNLAETFKQRTDQVFNEEFKGFDFKVGDNKYRYKLSNPNQVKQHQSDLNNFIKPFLGEDGSVENVAGYHKAIWAAENADTIAEHFYEQGKADALKNKAAKSKGINMDPRSQVTEDDTRQSGPKVRAVNSEIGTKLKFKNYSNR